MPPLTRRALIRKASLAASAATLLPSALPNAAIAESQQSAVYHVFAFQWKPDASEAQKAKAAQDIAAFQGQIPGLLETHVGVRGSSPRKSRRVAPAASVSAHRRGCFAFAEQ